ncbi:AAA-like domain-containing protein [Limnofasciculus baicalensis]|uniref:AAA-like domain-containing protein n=1 Tax=Limnofasciculus baicalensis BBK-W-15 TaxID=2699891 RepID=A0AAE3GRZ3_9CYAN|nr:AAA-like domain-containing protein [Limnofasciculus baicalensis]MCP2729439.1 AAA-like domain-containing protein [Limnofasciculus baicalensis BBK-W-15]
MNSEIEFTWEVARQIANEAVWQKDSEYLKDIEVIVLKGSWDGKSYQKIADKNSYQENYINQDVGNKLWRKLTKALGERVTKTNFREALKRKWDKEKGRLVHGMGQNHRVVSEKILEYPDKPLRWNSPFYVERHQVESVCDEGVLYAAALIRIRAPQKMGKTSLLKRILAKAKENGYRTVHLNLLDAEREVFGSLGKFLRWFAASVSLELGKTPVVDDYWGDNSWGDLISCKYYFQNSFLQDVDNPLVLGLDNLDRIFEHGKIAPNFLGMLRSWHEEGNSSEKWQNLSLVLANSDDTVKLWNLEGKELLTLTGHKDWVTSVSFSPDGKTIASGSGDGTVKLWNLEGKELLTLTGHESLVWSVSFSPDGKTIASGGNDGTVKLWNLEGKELLTLTGHKYSVYSVSFSPDRKTIASGSGDGTVKLWNLEGKQLLTLTGYKDLVSSVSFSPDGKMIASGGNDCGTLRVRNYLP